MRKFFKEIAPLGDHIVSDKSGKKRRVTITKEQAEKWIDNFYKMREHGLGVFAPWEHDFDNKPVEKVTDLLNAKNNGGEWINLKLEDDMLWGEIEAATEEDAERIGKTVKGCSLFTDDYVDGKGREWSDSILHICLTNKPVAVTGNYVPVNEENNLSIAMSTFIEKDENSTGVMAGLMNVLRKLGIELPASTDTNEFLKLLTVALDCKEMGDAISGGVPGNVKPKQPNLNLVMSTETQESETVTEPNPIETKLLDQNESLKEQNKALDAKLASFNAFFEKHARTELSNKIASLSESLGDDEDGKKLISSLKKQLESTEFSFDSEGNVIKTPLHGEIDLHLMYAGKKEKKVVPENSDEVPSNVQKKQVEEEPNDDPRAIAPEQLEDLIKAMPR